MNHKNNHIPVILSSILVVLVILALFTATIEPATHITIVCSDPIIVSEFEIRHECNSIYEYGSRIEIFGIGFNVWNIE